MTGTSALEGTRAPSMAATPACDAAALAKGSAGCGFWTLPPDEPTIGPGSCFAAAVVNASPTPTAIRVDWGGNPLDVSNSIYKVVRRTGPAIYTKLEGALQPGEHALVFLAQGPPAGSESEFAACPAGITPLVNVDPIKHGTVRTRAFHIETDAPVSAYSMYPYKDGGYLPTSTLLLPEASLENAYVGVTVGKFGDPVGEIGRYRTVQIVATADNTDVWIQPNMGLASQSAGTGSALSSSALRRGEVLQFTSENLFLSGGGIRTSKPVAVFGGAPCGNIPSTVPACDVFQQQIAPLSQWGTEYALVPYRSRHENARETVPWSLVGAVDGTVLTWTPMKPVGAPDRLDAGQVVDFMTDAIASVKSQDAGHPFYAAAHMTGVQPGNVGGMGDPDFVAMVPTAQFLDRYTFFVDHTFSESWLTVVRKKTQGTFKPVTLDCAGELSGWLGIGLNAEYEYAWVRLTSKFQRLAVGSGVCNYGRHEATSEAPFSLHVWGTSVYASYGFPAGMGTRKVNTASLPTPAL